VTHKPELSDTTTATRISETRAGISRGWRYTPLRKGKRPYLTAWPTRLDDAATMLGYAERGNVGLITGAASGIDVIDLDDVAVDRLSEFPATVTAITGGGGRHLYYVHDPAAAVRNWVGELGTHIDVRTTGGQVVAVGSIHASGHAYEWAPGLGPDEIDFAPLPTELIRRMYADEHPDAADGSQEFPGSENEVPGSDSPGAKTTRGTTKPAWAGETKRRAAFVTAALDNETTNVANASDGQGNASINRAAFNLGQLVAAGELSDADVINALTSATAHWSAHDGNDGSMRSAIQATIRSGLQAGKRNPRPASRMPSESAVGSGKRAQNIAGNITDGYRGVPDTDHEEELIEIPEGYTPREAIEQQDRIGDRADDPAGVSGEPSIAPATDTPSPAVPPVTSARPATPHVGKSIDPMGAANTGEGIRMGDRDPDSKRVVLSAKKTLPTAQAYIDEFHRHPDYRTIVFCGQVFYTWDVARNCWRELDPSIMDQKVQRWLHEALRYHRTPSGDMRLVPFESNPRSVADAIRTLRGETAIRQDIPHPSWLEGTPPRPLNEMIAFASNTMHIPTGELYAPTPRHWIQNALEFDYAEDAPPPKDWLAFLADVLGGDVDQIALLQEWFGYCLTPDMKHHKIFLFQGLPRCGKGTASRILERLVGLANVCNPSVEELADTFGLASFVGKSLAVFGDAKWSTREAAMAVEKLLRISGGDGVNVRRMYLPSLTNVKLPTRIMLLANDMPKFVDASGAMANRFLIVRSFVSYLNREDLTLEDRLVKELPGILLWAIEGWKRLRAQGKFTRPALMEKELSDLQESASPVMRFVADECTIGKDESCWTDEIWKAWEKWCKEEGEDPGRANELGRNLKSAVGGLVNDKSHGKRYYQGVSVKPI
jgi:P4 family phage/plasmid primase-like protien